jgi:serine/threonine protein phosphatase PrpC
MSFNVEVGHASERGQREVNEDFAIVVQMRPQDEAHGVMAVIADGVSAGGRGREAAQSTALGLVADYYATPQTWDTTVALDRLISAHNAWLADHNRRRQAYKSLPMQEGGGTAMTTLTALVLRGQTYTLAHVGDCRAYLLRGDDCIQLSTDHRLDHPDFSSGLTRAIGLDDQIRVDYLQGDLAIGDAFVLVCDGVHQSLPIARLKQLAQAGTADAAAAALVRAALDAGSTDNVSAVVLRVKGLASARLEDSLVRGRKLPVPPRLRAGDVIDGLTVEAMVADTGVHRIYRVVDQQGRAFALKTLHESRASDSEERAMLAHEAWLGQRVTERDTRGFVACVEPREPSAFYVLQEWVDGQTLQAWLQQGRRFEVREIVDGATHVARALGRLHRLSVVHRDIKPDNLHLGQDGQWRIFDLGVALSGLESSATRALHAGTPSYINPEQWQDESADAQSDLFALGVTLYQWLTGKLPYGEIEPYQGGRYRRDPVAPSRLRPDVPIWLDHVVLKAVARDKKQRFETAEELELALERGASRPLAAPAATPLMARDPAALLKLALGVSVLLNLLLIYWLLFLPR